MAQKVDRVYLIAVTQQVLEVGSPVSTPEAGTIKRRGRRLAITRFQKRKCNKECESGKKEKKSRVRESDER